MGSKNKSREKRQRKARQNNKLEKTVTPEKRKLGKLQITFLVGMTVVAAGLVLYLQS